jgi:hypothetical protein
MDPEDLQEDILNDVDLDFDKETKTRFRAAVAELNGSGGDGGGEGGDGDEEEKSASACAALEAAAALPAETLTVETMQKLIDTAVTEKDAALAENAELRARLAAFESTPPQVSK